jgi:tetratricopeptide (TPR) repeat protein
LDFFEAFSRRFVPSEHTHLDEGGASTCTDPSHHHDHDHDHDHDGHSDHGDDGHGESASGGDVREMLPWLKLAASLDPNNVETYTVTAFWLRTRLNRVREAEEVIRDGLWNNPRNPSLLFELGRIYYQDRKDYERARNVFEAGLQSWDRTESLKPEPDKFLALQLLAHLAELEEQTGHYDRSIQLWEKTKEFTPFPANAQKHIDDIREKMAPSPAVQ